MRLLLVLLALLSGLSLAEVSGSSARAQVMGAASGVVAAASADQRASVNQPKAQRPVCARRLIRTIALPVAAFARSTSIVICDRPRE